MGRCEGKGGYTKGEGGLDGWARGVGGAVIRLLAQLPGHARAHDRASMSTFSARARARASELELNDDNDSNDTRAATCSFFGVHVCALCCAVCRVRAGFLCAPLPAYVEQRQQQQLHAQAASTTTTVQLASGGARR